MEKAYIQSHVPVQYTQPDRAGFYDPNQQQLCAPQQMQQIQGTSVCSHMPQVQSQNNHTLNSTYMHLTVQQQYDTSFPPLTDTPKSPWQSGIQKTTKRQPRKTRVECKANQTKWLLAKTTVPIKQQ